MARRKAIRNPVYREVDHFQLQMFQLVHIDGLKLPQAAPIMTAIYQLLRTTGCSDMTPLT